MFLLACVSVLTWEFILLLHILIHLPTITLPCYTLTIFHPISTTNFLLVGILAPSCAHVWNPLSALFGHPHLEQSQNQLIPPNEGLFKIFPSLETTLTFHQSMIKLI